MLNPKLHLPRNIQHTRSTKSSILGVVGRAHVVKRAGVGEDRVVPVTHVRVSGDELGEARPLVGRGDQERVVRTDVGEREGGELRVGAAREGRVGEGGRGGDAGAAGRGRVEGVAVLVGGLHRESRREVNPGFLEQRSEKRNAR